MKRLFGIVLFVLTACFCTQEKYDICVYGGIASGIIAADVRLDKGELFSVKTHGDGSPGYIRAEAILLIQK